MSSKEPAAESRNAPVGTVLLLIVAVIFYAGMMGSLTDVSHTDAAGRGFAVAFGALFATVLFVDLAALLIVAAVKGRMSVAGKVGSLIVVPAATVAIWIAADAWANRDASAIWVPAALPPLIVLYGLRARFAPLRTPIPDVVADVAMAVVVVVLVVMPLERTLFPPPPDPVAEARGAEQEQARLEREEQDAREAREREAAQFTGLGPDSAMADYMPFLHGTYSREAHAGIRKVKTRQADTVVLLNEGRLDDLSELLAFDVDATPDVCAAYGAALARETTQVDPKVSTNALGVALELERQLPNLQWLAGEGCDLGVPLVQLEKNLRAVADSSRIVKLADELAKLRSR
jgi:hypothetical protein